MSSVSKSPLYQTVSCEQTKSKQADPHSNIHSFTNYMATALIIEDEYLAVQHLTRLLAEVAPEVQVLGLLQSVEESVEWFKSPAERGEGCTTPPPASSSSPMPDMVFMDIHLADGLAFRIFEQVEVPCPIIFTTAYDQYALQAFQVNSIDYLLKPISAADLRRALDKLGSRAAPPATDDALALSQSLTDSAAITEQYLIVNRAMQQDAPVISGWVIGKLGAVSNRLVNAHPDVFGTFLNVQDWDIQ